MIDLDNLNSVPECSSIRNGRCVVANITPAPKLCSLCKGIGPFCGKEIEQNQLEKFKRVANHLFRPNRPPPAKLEVRKNVVPIINKPTSASPYYTESWDNKSLRQNPKAEDSSSNNQGPSKFAAISIVIPVLNDQEEANNTVRSIRETTVGHNIEIIVIDDASDIPLKLEDAQVKLVRFNTRRGAGEARHHGALLAQTNKLLFIDAHMRFTSGWLDNALNNMAGRPYTLWCGVCLGLNKSNMDINKPMGEYNGADLVFHNDKTSQVFEGVWTPLREEEGNYQIPCIMGACYFMHRDWFFYIRGLETNRMWGYEEPFLSIKTWLAGGEVRLMRDVRIGHQFRESASYSTEWSKVFYNKIRYIHLLLPDKLRDDLISKIPDGPAKSQAIAEVQRDMPQILEEKAYYASIFKHDIEWLIKKFNIKI
jgi:glycosyltransferase involved in cell wall biosynthesis